MNINKIVYYVTTLLFCAMFTYGGIMDLSHNHEMAKSAAALGYPEYLGTILGVAMLCGVVSLLQRICYELKEWAYAGFTILLIGAAWSHIAAGQELSKAAPAIVFIIILGISYYFNYKLFYRKAKESK